MTLVTLYSAIAAVSVITAYGFHGAFEAHRNYTRFTRTATHREAFFLIQQTMPAHGGSRPARGQASQIEQGASIVNPPAFYQCASCSRLTPYSIQWGFAIRECVSCGTIS